MNLKKISAEELIKLQEMLNEVKTKYEAKGANNAYKLIKTKIKGDKSPRDGSRKNYKDYYSGYDAATNEILELIRDKLIFKS